MTGELPSVPDKSRVPILVVDDNAAKRLALRAVLLPLGHSIVEAESGTAALRCVMAQDFAVILLDVSMPVMDGFQTAALIRMRRQSELTPIIFITAYGADEAAQADHYAEGAVDFMYAPVPPDVLRAKVSVFANLHLKAALLAVRAGELQASADQLRLLTEAAPIGIFQTDAENRYVYTNPCWSEITGIRAVEAVGRSWDTIVGPEQRAHLTAEQAEGATLRGELRHRFELRRADGVARIVLLTSKAILSGGGTSGWVGTLADVTAEVGAEAAMADARDKATEASRLKSDFLANMSHEIRTPMNGVIGMTDLLLETDLDLHQRDCAMTVRNSGEALLTVINDILDFSMVEAGMLAVEDIDFSVRDVVDGVVDLLTRLVQAKGLELVVVIDDDVRDRVSGDPGRVRQVLTNLIGNAIKFTQAGEITVRVTQHRVVGAGVTARFEVSDTGDGIDPGKLALIFQPFAQADTSTSRRYGGTGLGLAISSHLVTLMGGECGVTSELGTGSSFWFTIGVSPDVAQSALGAPATPAPPADLEAVPATVLSVPGSEPRAGRLLLAEDNLINQKVAVAMLSLAGYHVDTVLNGAAAVQAFGAVAYDAILMDCQMPELSGYEATVVIRGKEGAGEHIPIIAMTAGARREDRERCRAAGMDGYLSKPVSKDALLATVARFLSPGASVPTPVVRLVQPPAADLPLDPTVLDELRALGAAADRDLLAELVDLFVQGTEPLLVQLCEAFEAGDAPGVGRIAHTIKGGCAQLGGQRLALSCARLGRRATAGRLAGGHGELEEVERDFHELRSALAQQLSSAHRTDTG